jgi:hypothetical protein
MATDTLCWTDIPITNLDRAIKFYSAVLGQAVKKLSEGGVEYGLLPHEEQNASGCLCVRSDSGGLDNTPSASTATNRRPRVPRRHYRFGRQSYRASHISFLALNTSGRRLKIVHSLMGDPRNVAHAKKVTQEKHHKGAPQPGKKTPTPGKEQPADKSRVAKPAETPAVPAQTPDAAKLEKSLAVLAQLKDMEFHSRANIEKLAELSLTIEDELKQKAFVESIEALYSDQDAFHSKAVALVEAYQSECDRLKPAG